MAGEYRSKVKSFMKDYRAGLKTTPPQSGEDTTAPAYANKYEARKAGMEAAKAGLSTLPEGFEAKFGKRLGRVSKRIAAAKKTPTTVPSTNGTVPAPAPAPFPLITPLPNQRMSILPIDRIPEPPSKHGKARKAANA